MPPRDFHIPFTCPSPDKEDIDWAENWGIAWVKRLGFVPDDPKTDARYKLLNYAWFVASSCHGLPREKMVPEIQAMYLTGVVDDFFDRPQIGEELGREVCRQIHEFLRTSHTSPSHHPFVHAFADLWRHLTEGMSDYFAGHAGVSWTSFFLGCTEEIRMRDTTGIPKMEDYMATRRKCIAMNVFFEALQAARGFEVPAEIYEQPLFAEMRQDIHDAVIFSNDIQSIRKDCLTGGVSNSIFVLQHHAGLGRGQAEAHLYEKVQEIFRNIQRLRDDVPSLCENSGLDLDLAISYAELLTTVLAGAFNWVLRSGVYDEEFLRVDIENLLADGP
ncbi:terpene synthase family protein [Streptomyces sp. NPDC020379]|uniref:terpene synthase family protein n=1 Tax=Streptomyces sp. NPDC020379 TaxID=3365071 RepID=UPI0037B9BBF1